jgi:hypothetical protein
VKFDLSNLTYRAKKEEETGECEHLCSLYYSFNIDNLIKLRIMKQACMNGKYS